MDNYCVNRREQANGDHEVHKAGCQYWPTQGNAEELGPFPGCAQAVQAAKRHFSQVNGCKTCSYACHTQ